MKVYSISSPEKLRDIAGAIKWDRDRKKVMELAETWERESWDGQQEIVTLEVGRNAHIFRMVDGKKKLIATMYVAAARDIAKELTEA